MKKEICSGCEEISASGPSSGQTVSAAAIQGREGQVLLRGGGRSGEALWDLNQAWKKSWIQAGKGKLPAGEAGGQYTNFYSVEVPSHHLSTSLPPSQVATFSRKYLRNLNLPFPHLSVWWREG